MTADVHTLVGAYALDALDDTERGRFERHLEVCPSCRAEVDGFRATAARLGAEAAEPPPPELKQRVLAGADVTRQHAPTPGWRSAAGPLRRVALPAAAALLAVAVALGSALWLRSDRPRVAPEDVAAILAAPDARAVPMTAGGDVTANLVAAPGADRALLAVRGLEETNRVYVLWAVRDGVPVNTGELKAGDTTVILEDLATAAQVIVTTEPRADVPAPTGPIVAQAELP